MTELITFTAIAILFAMLATFIVLMPIAIIFNFKAGLKYREALAGKLGKLRLGKMLAALGIDIDEYLSKERAVDIHQQMDRCQACANTEECDDRLAAEDVDPNGIGFCNNEASLQDILRSQK